MNHGNSKSLEECPLLSSEIPWESVVVKRAFFSPRKGTEPTTESTTEMPHVETLPGISFRFRDLYVPAGVDVHRLFR